MASHACSAVLASSGAPCGGHKAHPIHSRTSQSADRHPYLDSRGQGGLKPQSAGRTEYLRSEAHREAYAEVTPQSVCVFEAAGAPDPCRGPITPHHTLSRARAGGLETAERIAPVAAACAYHNTWVSQDANGIAFGETHTFRHTDGRDWPLLMPRAMARALIEATEGGRSDD